MTYNDMVALVAKKLGLPERLVDKTYRSYWKAVREHISSIPFREGLTDEEFKKVQPNVNIPSLGKLHVSLDRYKKLRDKIEEIKSNNSN